MRVIYQGELKVKHVAGAREETWFYVPEKDIAVRVDKMHQFGGDYKTDSPILEWLSIGVQVIIVIDQGLPYLRSIFNQIWDWITATKEQRAALKAVRLAKKNKD